MELYCMAPLRKDPRQTCNRKLGESVVPVEPMPVVIARWVADYEKLLPPPRCVKQCRRCRMWSVYEPARRPTCR